MSPETQPWGQRKHVDGHSWCLLLPEVHAWECTASQAVGASDVKCHELKPRFVNYWRGLCCLGRKACMLRLFHKLLAKSRVLPWMPLHCCSGYCTVCVCSCVAATLLKLKNTCVSMCRWLRCSSPRALSVTLLMKTRPSQSPIRTQASNALFQHSPRAFTCADGIFRSRRADWHTYQTKSMYL